MCIGIIRNNSLVGGRAWVESNHGYWARHALLHMAAECVNHSATMAGVQLVHCSKEFLRIHFYHPSRMQRVSIARYMLWSGVCVSITSRYCIETAGRIEMVFGTYYFFRVSGFSGVSKLRILSSGTLSKLWTFLLFRYCTSTVVSVINVVRPSLVYHTQHLSLFTTRRPWRRASRSSSATVEPW